MGLLGESQRRCCTRNPQPSAAEQPMATDFSNRDRIQALCWLVDELLDGGDDLRALVVRPQALRGWRRQQLAALVRDLGEALERELP